MLCPCIRRKNDGGWWERESKKEKKEKVRQMKSNVFHYFNIYEKVDGVTDIHGIIMVGRIR